MLIAFDTELRRPGCVIIQAALGAFVDPKTECIFSRLFPSETWLVELTPTMRVFEASDSQLVQLVNMAKKAINYETSNILPARRNRTVRVSRRRPATTPG